MEMSPLPVKGCKIESYAWRSSRAIEQGVMCIVPHLLWHGALNFTFSSKGPPHLVTSYNMRGALLSYKMFNQPSGYGLSAVGGNLRTENNCGYILWYVRTQVSIVVNKYK